MLSVVPISFIEARQFVADVHRHHKPPAGMKFCVAVSSDSEICGVAIVGRPVARMLDDGTTLEVLRVATIGTKNACSMLYGAAWRAAKALGYRRLITYTLAEEGGASLRASNWRCVAEKTGGGSWSRSKRPRVDTHPLQHKLRWEVS